MINHSNVPVHQYRLIYQAWLGMDLIEDATGHIARASGCAESEAWNVRDTTLHTLIKSYAQAMGLTHEQAQVELDGCDTQGRPSLVPDITQRSARHVHFAA